MKKMADSFKSNLLLACVFSFVGVTVFANPSESVVIRRINQVLRNCDVFTPVRLDPKWKNQWNHARSQLAYSRLAQNILVAKATCGAYATPTAAELTQYYNELEPFRRLRETLRDSAEIAKERLIQDAHLSKEEIKQLDDEADIQECALNDSLGQRDGKEGLFVALETQIANANDFSSQFVSEEDKRLEDTRSIARESIQSLLRTPIHAYELARSCGDLFLNAVRTRAKNKAKAAKKAKELEIRRYQQILDDDC